MLMVCSGVCGKRPSATQLFAASNASAIRKSVAAARSIDGLRRAPLQNRGNCRGFSALKVSTLKLLEGQIDATADHNEIILRPVDDPPAQIIRPANIAREPAFKAEAEMAHHLGLSVEMMTLRVNGGKLIR
jgi:hypothetical protein